MPRRAVVARLGVFAVVVAVVVAATAGAGVVLTEPTDSAPAPDPDSFRPENVVAEPVDQDGSVTINADTEGKTVLIDDTKASRFDRGELDPLVNALIRNGHTVRFRSARGSGFGGGFNASLREADALVVVGPGATYSDQEVASVTAFAEAGGRVVVLTDAPGGSDGPLSAGGDSQFDTLGSEFGLVIGGGYLYNMHENANNFQRVFGSPAGDSPLTAGVDRLVFGEAIPIAGGEDAEILVETDERTALSSTRERDRYAVAVKSGNVVFVGDRDFATVANADDADNDQFLGRLGRFLVTGNKREGAPGR